uniref:RRM domain-containing protein n=1 Tax=Chromera velia CCMP2878 TaxID=1169474 RepID=A0A0G4HYD5_9ALVE|eukprot:Cvel_9468.t1-p1 / transcript=Cvel_9468.t1 / gene=Cvel_9468 / organism=Chromera_velia_CCMP2878 / gene_product=CUGBP Elav-like family member 5, putative / transcript_product=CUGBP Elav-like family member 5, putative / location=Cvel_scaffold546:73867-76216(-) / protein_length=503 / sequence_SO=supercontig / SO=protein_coding / is_pseudo=false
MENVRHTDPAQLAVGCSECAILRTQVRYLLAENEGLRALFFLRSDPLNADQLSSNLLSTVDLLSRQVSGGAGRDVWPLATPPSVRALTVTETKPLTTVTAERRPRGHVQGAAQALAADPSAALAHPHTTATALLSCAEAHHRTHQQPQSQERPLLAFPPGPLTENTAAPLLSENQLWERGREEERKKTQEFNRAPAATLAAPGFTHSHSLMSHNQQHQPPEANGHGGITQTQQQQLLPTSTIGDRSGDALLSTEGFSMPSLGIGHFQQGRVFQPHQQPQQQYTSPAAESSALSLNNTTSNSSPLMGRVSTAVSMQGGQLPVSSPTPHANANGNAPLMHPTPSPTHAATAGAALLLHGETAVAGGGKIEKKQEGLLSLSVSGGGSGMPSEHFIENMQGRNLFVFHLPNDWGEGDLREHFEKFGPITSVLIAREGESGRKKGFGFVCFESPACALSAISGMNGFSVGGKRLSVQLKQSSLRRHPLAGVGGQKRQVGGGVGQEGRR